MPVRIVVVWNGKAGSAAGISADDVRARLERDTGAEVVIEPCSEPRDPGAIARAAVAGGADGVVAAGGDGTVSSVAAEVVGTEANLGVLPLGTSNSFAAAMGIPGDVEGALEVLGSNARRVIDVAVARSGAGERTMVLHCTVGFHADVIGETSTDAKQRWGVLAYAATALRRLASVDTFAVELSGAAHVIKCRASAIAAANLAPIKTVLAHGPSHVLGDDGMLDVTIVAVESIPEAIATGVHLWRRARGGEAADRDNIGSFAAASVAITADPPQHVLIDGEPFGMTPVTLETRPRALRVIAPPAPEAQAADDAHLSGLPDLEISSTARS